MNDVLPRVMSVLGVPGLIGLAWLLSENKKRVPWRLVAWGTVMQLGFAAIVLKTTIGLWTFSFLNDVMDRLLGFTADGSRFVFGEDHADTLVDALDHGFVDGAAAVVHAVLGHHRSLRCIRRLERRMHGEVRHIKEERLLRVLADELGRAVVDEVGEVAFELHRLQTIAQGIGAVVVGVFVIVRVAEQFAEVLVKAAVHGVVFIFEAEMPFAENTRGIARGLHFLRERDFTQRQAEAVKVLLRHPLAFHTTELLDLIAKRELDAATLLPASGHEAGACRRADRRVRVKVGELHTLGRETIDVRRGDVRATHATKVAVAEVIREDENDVWRSRVKRRAEGDEDQ